MQGFWGDRDDWCIPFNLESTTTFIILKVDEITVIANISFVFLQTIFRDTPPIKTPT